MKKAMHVCGDAGNDAFAGAAGGCISLPGFDAGDTFDYSTALAYALDAGVPVTMFYGKQDTACNYVGGFAVAETLPWKGQAEFSNKPMEPLEIAGVEAGQTKSAGGLTWMQVDGAGHMVGMNAPAANAAALETIVGGLTAAFRERKAI